jgi:hypothetical protein
LGIRVFISHSTKPQDGEEINPELRSHQQFVKDFISYVKDNVPGIECFFDGDIDLSAIWREVIWGKLGSCHAAVVFVNRRALNISQWVNAETIVLGYRKYTEKERFDLFLIPFDGVKAANIAKHPKWEPVNIGELQILPRDGLDVTCGDSVDDIFQQIATKLKTICDSDEETSSAWIVLKLCSLLPKEQGVISDIALMLSKSLHSDLADLSSRNLARYIYSKGPVAIKELLRVPSMPNDTDFRTLLDLVTTYWVDMESSLPILSYSSANKGNVFVINCKEIRYTPETYIRQVCGSNYPWNIYTVDDCKVDVNYQIYSWIARMKAFRIRLGNIDQHVDDESLKKINDFMVRPGAAPLFVTFFAEGGEGIDDRVSVIHGVFPYINIIICTGTEKCVPLLLMDNRFIMLKKIDLDEERKEFDSYCEVMGHLSNNN